MNISLTPELERYVQNKVASGLYSSASEVIRHALRLMQMQEELQRKNLMHIQEELDKKFLDETIKLELARIRATERKTTAESKKQLKQKKKTLKSNDKKKGD